MTHSEFKPHLLIRNKHLQSIIPSQFRNIKISKPIEFNINADLGDTLDVDFYDHGKNECVILSHGLEGHSKRPYILGMIEKLSDGYDCYAWNYRTCGKHFTESKQLYHNGKIDDLHRVIEHVLKRKSYEKIHLLGFSMGANLNLLYLGTHTTIPEQVKSAVAISAAMDLRSSALILEKGINYIYMKRFLIKLKQKLERKKSQFPDLIDLENYDKIRSFREFDNRYTAPLHGFADVYDYWERCSSRPHLKDISVPVLILSSLDDPFLGSDCFPDKQQINNDLITLQYTRFGGHDGYVHDFQMVETYAESEAHRFFLNQ